MSYGVIYKITNKINGKCYIGQTTKSLQIRWRNHVNNANTRPKFPLHMAIRKYVAENFTIETVCECNDQIELNNKEKEYTDYYNAWIGKGGYTCIAGNGKGALSEETRRKITITSTGRKHTDEAKKKQSDSKLGNKNPNYGKKLSKETIEKRTRKQTGLKRSEEAKKNYSLSKIGDKNPMRHRTIEARDKAAALYAKTYILISPEGILTSITNMRKFCRENTLDPGSMIKVYYGKDKQHKGWRLDITNG